MIAKLVHYTVKEGKLPEVEAAVREFMAEIAVNEPATQYQAYQSDNILSFYHYMLFADEAAEHSHRNAPYTMKFVNILYPNCDASPHFIELNPLQ